MANPVISALSYTVTDTTIVAVWTTDISADSNLFAGAKAAIDNGVAASGTSHQCIVTGLLPNTVYSCHVVSGATTGSSSNVTTNPRQNRILVTSATMGGISTGATAPIGDTYRTFVSSDNKTYITQDDGEGFVDNTPNASYNTELGVLTNESTMVGTFVSLANYGALNTSVGTDGPAGTAMSNKSTGLFGLNGNLHFFAYRQFPPTYTTNRYCNIIKSTNHGSTWNNFNDLSTFTAGGNVLTPQSPSEPVQFYSNLVGLVSPVLYAADDGTLGYNTAGNQIDGANGYVYMTFNHDAGSSFYLMRVSRIKFDAQDLSAPQYWVGPASPAVADFTNDSNWTLTEGSEQQILPTGGGAWVQAAFIPAINSYILTTWITGSGGGTAFKFYSAPTPAGPWTSFFIQQNPTVGSQWYGPFPFHRDCLSNTLTDSIPVKIMYQGEASPGTHYKPNWSTLTLATTTPPSPPANTFVQSNGDTSGHTATTYTLAYSSNVTTGNILVCAWRRATAGGAVTSVTSTQVTGNWNLVYDAADAGASISGGWAWAIATSTGACTVTVHLSGSVAGGVLVVGEWNGANTLRATSTVATGTSTTPISNSITAVAGDLLVCVAEPDGASSALAGSGYVYRQSGTAAAIIYTQMEDALNAAGGSTTGSFTNVGTAAIGWTCGLGAFYFVASEFSIAGAAGLAGATVSYSGTASGSVVADSSGNYTIPNLFAGSYTITPSFGGYTFSPANRSQTITTANVTGVNFTASVATVVGNAGSLSLRRRLRKNVIS